MSPIKDLVCFTQVYNCWLPSFSLFQQVFWFRILLMINMSLNLLMVNFSSADYTLFMIFHFPCSLSDLKTFDFNSLAGFLLHLSVPDRDCFYCQFAFNYIAFLINSYWGCYLKVSFLHFKLYPHLHHLVFYGLKSYLSYQKIAAFIFD